MRVLSYKGRAIQKGSFIFNIKNNRNRQISKNLLNKPLMVYNGKQEKRFNFKKKHLNTKIGQYYYTKRLSFKIHIKKNKKKGKKKGKKN